MLKVVFPHKIFLKISFVLLKILGHGPTDRLLYYVKVMYIM